LNSRKEELQKLKEEEQALEKEYDTNLKEKEHISTQLQDTHVQISQVRAMVTQLEEVQSQMKSALLSCKAAVEENNASMVSDYSLGIEPEFRDFKQALLSPEEKPKQRESQGRLHCSSHQLMKVFSTEFNDSKSVAFKPSTFDDNFDNKPSAFGDDDSWNTNQWSTGASDPFAGSKPDPFASNASPAKADVSTKSLFVESLSS
jgi:epidermal growth factor receptor substrate 15